MGASNDGGYPERLYQRLKSSGFPAGIMNLAQSGATSAQVLARQVLKAEAAKPALVTLGIGSNDVWRMISPKAFASNVTAIADSLERSGAHVVVSTLVDLTLAPIASMVQGMLGVPLSMVKERLEAFNAVLNTLKTRPRFEVVDLFSLTRREQHRVAELFSADGFHPSASGYDLWAQTLWQHVEPIARAWQPFD